MLVATEAGGSPPTSGDTPVIPRPVFCGSAWLFVRGWAVGRLGGKLGGKLGGWAVGIGAILRDAIDAGVLDVVLRLLFWRSQLPARSKTRPNPIIFAKKSNIRQRPPPPLNGGQAVQISSPKRQHPSSSSWVLFANKILQTGRMHVVGPVRDLAGMVPGIGG